MASEGDDKVQDGSGEKNLKEAFLLLDKAVNSFVESAEMYRQSLEQIHDWSLVSEVIKLEQLLRSNSANDSMSTVCNSSSSPLIESRIRLLAMIRQMLWEKLHAVQWQKTPLVYRSLFGEISCLLIVTCFLNNPLVELEKLIYTADLGLLLGTPDSAQDLNHIISLLSSIVKSPSAISVPESSILANKNGQCRLPSFHSTRQKNPLPVVQQPTILEFYDNYFRTQAPVILINCTNDWPAMNSSDRNWQNLDYILRGKV
jgi:hypothetical protein